jgi:hypothetical protein
VRHGLSPILIREAHQAIWLHFKPCLLAPKVNMTKPEKHTQPANAQVPPAFVSNSPPPKKCGATFARLYRVGKSGQRDVSDVSHLANVLSLLSRAIKVQEMERRIGAVEKPL